jgi:hypothetical protein
MSGCALEAVATWIVLGATLINLFFTIVRLGDVRGWW